MDKIQEGLNELDEELDKMNKMDFPKLDISNYKLDIKVDGHIGKLHPINSLGALSDKRNPLSIKLDNLNG